MNSPFLFDIEDFNLQSKFIRKINTPGEKGGRSYLLESFFQLILFIHG